jgi:hypothetical protein
MSTPHLIVDAMLVSIVLALLAFGNKGGMRW